MEKKQKKENKKIITLSILLFIFIISIIFTSPISSGIKKMMFNAGVKIGPDDLVVHYINVGQGDAIAIQMPNGKIMIIDAGPKDSQNKLIYHIKNEVLKSNNNMVIDYVVLTHPDIDHSGGMCAVFAEFEVKNFLRPNIASASENNGNFVIQSDLEEYDELIKSAKQEDAIITIMDEKMQFNIGNVAVNIFPPIKRYSTTNEMSPVIKISYLNKSFLFTGDIQEDGESDMLDKYGAELNADVLKVAHHGSKSSTSVYFVNAVSPKYAVICVGENAYGHPHFMTVSNLENAGAKVVTTKTGNVRFVCGKEYFGILNSTYTHSTMFVNWWIIALGVILVLIFNLICVIIYKIKARKIFS